jgi:hypothetical protein
MLFSLYKADFLRFFPENPANYVSILMCKLQRKAPSNRSNRSSISKFPELQNYIIQEILSIIKII